MNADQRLLVIGIYINSALYLAGVFVAGIITNNPTAWKLSLATAGFCYLTYTAQVMGAQRAACLALFATSVVLGVFSGLSLLW